MKFFATNEHLSLTAFAAHGAVLLAWDVNDETLLSNSLGFALRRRQGDSDGFFLSGGGVKSLPGVKEPRYPVLQTFTWNDYTCKASQEYFYDLCILRGSVLDVVLQRFAHAFSLERRPLHSTADDLKLGESISLTLTAVSNDDESREHSVWFNRGVAGSQGYSRRFGDVKPADVEDRAAFKWLSNGLEEALMAFVDAARDERDSLRIAAYEFKYEPLLLAFKAARERGVDIKIVVDWKVKKDGSFKSKSPEDLDHVEESHNAIEATGLPRDILIERRAGTSFISHNKFIILIRDGQPTSVWTGSTNFTEGGLFGQSNVGHVMRNAETAQAFLDYWTRLSTDPAPSEMRRLNDEVTPLPKSLAPRETVLLFSPRTTDNALELYTDLLVRAKHSVHFTAAFGVNEFFATALARTSEAAQRDGVLRYILLEKSDARTRELEKDASNRIAVGSVIDETAAAALGVLPEAVSGLNDHVAYIHTKYLLIDAFSDSPIVIAGSANFSRASNVNNDENMAIVRGDTALAHEYGVHFMRLWRHFDHRYRVKKAGAAAATPLAADDSWRSAHFVADSVAARERKLFCATTAAAEATAADTIEFDADQLAAHRPPPREKSSTARRTAVRTGDEWRLTFSYNAALVAKIKELPAGTRRWHAADKVWLCAASEQLDALLRDNKFKVESGN